MRSLVSRPGGRRRASLLYGVVASLLLLAASPARAQRLLTLVSGVGEAASVGDAGASMGPAIGPVPVAVQVDLDLLRSSPFRLEVPTPDGSVLSAERSVFEDRGGGDLMWSGGQPGAGYDTVVLTVEGGRFVGRFAAAAGGAYQIDADRDGIGGMTPVVNERPEGWCGVDSGAGDDHVGHAHGAAPGRHCLSSTRCRARATGSLSGLSRAKSGRSGAAWTCSSPASRSSRLRTFP